MGVLKGPLQRGLLGLLPPLFQHLLSVLQHRGALGHAALDGCIQAPLEGGIAALSGCLSNSSSVSCRSRGRVKSRGAGTVSTTGAGAGRGSGRGRAPPFATQAARHSSRRPGSTGQQWPPLLLITAPRWRTATVSIFPAPSQTQLRAVVGVGAAWGRV